MTTHFDVIIIGSGAGGGTLAYRLAPSGKRILLLERGERVPREQDNWSPRAVNVETKYHPREVWHTGDGAALHPHTNYYVGGNTKFYGAALFRLREEASRRHGRSAIGTSSLTTRRPNASITCTASAASIRPNRRRARPTLTRRSRTNRGFRSCTTTSSVPGIGRFPSRSA
jgi:glycine/D-amino acid oxidase-like deaminating enzyme